MAYIYVFQETTSGSRGGTLDNNSLSPLTPAPQDAHLSTEEGVRPRGCGEVQ